MDVVEKAKKKRSKEKTELCISWVRLNLLGFENLTGLGSIIYIVRYFIYNKYSQLTYKAKKNQKTIKRCAFHIIK